MKRLVFLGTLIALSVMGLAVGSLAGAQEVTGSIPDPQPSTQLETPPPPGGDTRIAGTIPDPQPSTPVDQYNDVVGTIPTPQPSTPVEGPPSTQSDISELPDTGGLDSLPWIAGALLLGGGMVIRRIVR